MSLPSLLISQLDKKLASNSLTICLLPLPPSLTQLELEALTCSTIYCVIGVAEI